MYGRYGRTVGDRRSIAAPGLAARGQSGARGQSIVEFALLAPLMLLIMFAIFDLSRIYTTMMSVESAAREAADFGTELGASRWSSGAFDVTLAEMRRRACVAASDLPDYVGIDANADGIDEDCSNPSFDWCLIQTIGGTCDKLDPNAAGYTCDDPERDPPCYVKVTLSHTFKLFIPFHINFFGVDLGLPASLSFQRDSTFAMTDISAPGASATP
jgi:hypothetical protein